KGCARISADRKLADATLVRRRPILASPGWQESTDLQRGLLRILFVNYEYPPLGGGGAVANPDFLQRANGRSRRRAPAAGAGVPRCAWEGGSSPPFCPINSN